MSYKCDWTQCDKNKCQWNNIQYENANRRIVPNMSMEQMPRDEMLWRQLTSQFSDSNCPTPPSLSFHTLPLSPRSSFNQFYKTFFIVILTVITCNLYYLITLWLYSPYYASFCSVPLRSYYTLLAWDKAKFYSNCTTLQS